MPGKNRGKMKIKMNRGGSPVKMKKGGRGTARGCG